MKTFNRSVNQITANGPEVIKNTKEYKQKIANIYLEVTLKYDQKLKCEKNIFKRILLRLKKREEIKRAIRELTSPGNLYIAVDYFK